MDVGANIMSAPLGGLQGQEWGDPPPEEQLKMRAQQAIYVLAQARRIRGDAELMAAIRAHLREQRDEMALLLDDLG